MSISTDPEMSNLWSIKQSGVSWSILFSSLFVSVSIELLVLSYMFKVYYAYALNNMRVANLNVQSSISEHGY